MTEYIALYELARELGRHPKAMHKVPKRMGIEPIMRRDPDRRNQRVACVTLADAERIRAECRVSEVQTESSGETYGETAGENGIFYIIQLEPNHDPDRIKVGFTTDLDHRLRQHRCSAPFAEVVRCWPCRRTWERAALDCVTDGLNQLHTEVFRVNSIEETMHLGDKFFAAMPKIKKD